MPKTNKRAKTADARQVSKPKAQPKPKKTTKVIQQSPGRSNSRSASPKKVASKAEPRGRAQKQPQASKSISKTRAKSPVSKPEIEVQIAKGSFVAFIDTRKVKSSTHANFDSFKLAQVDKDMLDSEAHLKVKVYQDNNEDTTYKLEKVTTIQIYDYQMISKLTKTPTVSKDGVVKLTKTEVKNINKQLDATVAQVKAQLGLDSDDEDQDSDESVEQPVVKPVAKKRTIVKAKRQISQVGSKRSSSRVKESPKKELIDTKVVKTPAKQRTKSQVKSSAEEEEPIKIGAKRKQRPKKASSEGEDEAAESYKLKKHADGTEEKKVVPKVKKAPKMPTVFKLGKWNPETVLVERDDMYEDPSTEADYNCCHRCNARNVIRAVTTDQPKLLEQLLNDKFNVYNVNEKRSKNDEMKPLDLILQKEDTEMLEILMCPKIPQNPLFAHNPQQLKNEFFNTSRRIPKKYLLQKIQQGQVSVKAYGTAIRQVEMSRGNRQGNNAFIENINAWNQSPGIPQGGWQQHTAQGNDYNKLPSMEMMKNYHKLTDFNAQDWKASLQVPYLACYGKRDWMVEVISAQIKHENFGWNQCHLDCVSLDELTEKYHTASLTKKCNSAQNITPIHLACINPSTAVLQKLMEQNQEVNVLDTFQRKPIHYAAACEGSGPLELLLSLGANAYDIDQFKTTALHYAAKAGRADNIKILLENQPKTARLRDRQKLTPMAYACMSGKKEPILAFLDSKIIKIGQGQGPERIPTLSWAAARGDYDFCKQLLDDYKARVLAKDKFKKLPIHHAIINGHAKVASLLLQYGSDWNAVDSSGNSCLHYAAANGQFQCVDLLMRHGAEINAENMWKVTPINIAMLMNHVGMVKRLLQEEGVDVNGKDDNGRTLLALTCIDLSDEKMVDFAEYLLSKGANPNLPDINGNTVLHALATYTTDQPWRRQYPYNQQPQDTTIEDANHLRMIDLILAHDGDVSLINKEKENPFGLALGNDNIQVLKKLSSKVLISENPKLFFDFQSKIFQDDYKNFLIDIVNKEPELDGQVVNVLNKTGFTPFLAYIREYVTKCDAGFFRNLITQVLTIEVAIRQGRNMDDLVITNEQIFAKDLSSRASQHQMAQMNQFCPMDQFNALVEKFIDQLVTSPFIALLSQLVQWGARTSVCVDKLEFYRELDQHKRQVLGINEVREEYQMVENAINTNQKVEQKEVKTRVEAIRQQNVEGRKSGNKEKKKNKMSKINEKLLDFYTKREHQPKYEKNADGVEVEIEFDTEYGQQNAVHLLMRNPNSKVLKYLLNDLNLDNNRQDFQGRNPFLLNATISPGKRFDESMEMLMEQDASVDSADKKGRTPHLIYYSEKNYDNAKELIIRGANINHMDNSGLFALKYALIRRDQAEITRLVKEGAEINKIDNKGRNLLHHAVNMSSATADATFETEQQLIDLGININLKDNRLRVPLHYAFVKIKNWTDKSQLDPIETVSSICGQPGLLLDEADEWLKTPLHYAAQRGASISSLYMLQRGSNLEKTDIYENTPLGCALLGQHFNYCILLIQKEASVIKPIFDEYPATIAWNKYQAERQKKREARMGQDVDMSESDDNDNLVDAKGKKAHRGLFTQKPKRGFGMFGYGSEDESDESDSDYSNSDSEDEVNAFNNNNAFNQQVMTRKKVTQQKWRGGQSQGFAFGAQAAQPAFGQPMNQLQQNQVAEIQARKGGKMKDPGALVKKTRSSFRISIQSVQQGLAYMILDNGYNYMRAMQDAMDEGKFQLVVTLLAKTQEDATVCQKNDKGQNLLMVLAQNASKCPEQHLSRIYNIFKKRGINMFDSDNTNTSALHYAVSNNCFHLVNLLILEGLNVNQINNDGHSPLSLFLKTRNGLTECFAMKAQPQVDNLLNNAQQPNAQRFSPAPNNLQNAGAIMLSVYSLLARQNVDMNIKFPEQRYVKNPLAYYSIEELKAEKEEKDPLKMYKCTPIILFARQLLDHKEHASSHHMNNLIANITGMVTNNGTLDAVDSEGRTALMYAVMNNDERMTDFLINSLKTSRSEINQQDKDGKSVAHFVVNPMMYGSYENKDLLSKLYDCGLKLNLKDNSGKTPIDYAREQSSGIMADFLGKALQIPRNSMIDSIELSYAPESDWPANQHDFNEDASTLLDQAEEKRKAEIMQAEEGYSFVPIDKSYDASQIQYKVYYTEEGKPYDCYMTKVDLKNGIYGDFVFYKMQLLHDTNLDLYIVLTRYGRIGELGMHQRSPFNKLADAIEDFHTIFKQKTSNEFPNLENFEKVKKKYAVVQVHYSSVKNQDYLAPFDFRNCAQTQTLVQHKQVYDCVEEISNVTMFNKAMNGCGIDQDLMPISSLKKEVIYEAVLILKDLAVVINEIEELRKQQLKADLDEIDSVRSKCASLSSKFYQLIPFTEGKNDITRPIATINQLQDKFQQLDTLTGVEFSNRILLGALLRQREFNPIDYVYQAINTKIELMRRGDPELELIHRYVTTTSQVKEFRVFKIQRKGEAERFEPNKAIGNRRLLFHGSGMSNYLGILAQGLRIAPKEAPTTGFMFGKGVYFADTFEKSKAYAQKGVQSGSGIMLLCEVALGKMKKLRKAEYVENLESEFQSVMGCGSQGPDFKKKKVITPKGFALATGPCVSYPQPSDWEAQCRAKQAEQQANQQSGGLFGGGFSQPAQAFGGGGIFGAPRRFGQAYGMQGVTPYFSLAHNEYIVYNTDQIKMRYMIQFS